MTTPLFTGIKICQHIANRLLYSAPPYLLPCGLTFGPLGGDEAARSYDKPKRATRAQERLSSRNDGVMPFKSVY